MSAEGGIPFGSYTLYRRLARGGMAEVFLARQRHLDGYDRRVAVKRILPHLSDSADFVRMFLGEARLAARLTHPNIVHIYDFGKVADEYYIAMEYVDGVHAGQLIKHAAKESLPPTLIARIGADASAALHYAHSFTDGDGKPLRLVHRDVSPPNLMVSFDGVVKLVDFGIAKATAVEQLTNPGTVKGKYAYMSPEQTTARTLDGRSDVFSLGLVLWELIAGRYIVERGNPVDAMRAIRDGKLPRIESVAPRTPRELVQALELALETDREDRASALELSQILEAYIKAAPELATAMQMATWVRSRFQPVLTGPLPSLADAGGGTKVATSASSAAQSVITPASRDKADDYGARTPVVEMTDHGGDTMINASTIALGGNTSTMGGSTDRHDGGLDDGDDLDNSETRIAEGREERPTRPRPSRTTPPPVPRKTPPARPITEDHGSDLDYDETIARGPAVKSTVIMPPPPPHVRPEDRPTEIEAAARNFDTAPGERKTIPDIRATVVAGEVRAIGGPGVPPLDPALSGEPTIVAGAPAPAYGSPPPGPVAAGTQTNNPALPMIDRLDPTNVDRTRPHAERTATRLEQLAALSPRRRAALAAIAGGICAAVIGVVCVAARGGDDRAAVPPDAALVVATPADAAPVTTELRIVTDPAGAVAQVGTRRGQTPITFAVEPGPVKVHIELAGHVPVDRTMQLKPGDHLVLDLTLDENPVPVIVVPDAAPRLPDKVPDRTDRVRKPGALSVRTTPYSDVYLGKRLLGQSPFAELSLPAGTHTLTFKHPGRRTVTRAVVITSGKTTKLNLTLP